MEDNGIIDLATDEGETTIVLCDVDVCMDCEKQDDSSSSAFETPIGDMKCLYYQRTRDNVDDPPQNLDNSFEKEDYELARSLQVFLFLYSDLTRFRSM